MVGSRVHDSTPSGSGHQSLPRRPSWLYNFASYPPWWNQCRADIYSEKEGKAKRSRAWLLEDAMGIRHHGRALAFRVARFVNRRGLAGPSAPPAFGPPSSFTSPLLHLYFLIRGLR